MGFQSSVTYMTHLISILIGFHLYRYGTQKVLMMTQVKSS